MKKSLPARLAICCAMIGFGCPVIALGQIALHRNESEQVEEYLRSLQLDRLLIEHLEFQTSRETDLKTRRTMAARLAELYSEKMMSGTDAGASDWRSRTELLLKTYPELATPSIRIAMIQSNYLQGEKSFREWWNQGRPANQLGQLVEHWRILKSELTSLHQKLETDYEDQVAFLQTFSENQDLESRRLIHTEGLLLHANYLMGWSAYFHGILVPEQRKENMRAADSHFRNFLQIEPDIILNDVSPKWIDFSSDWNARALVGLAMCQRGLNHDEQSAYCFDLLENHSPDQQTRNLRFVWDLNARLYLDDFLAAEEVVESVERTTDKDTRFTKSGRIAFWLATLNASVAIRDPAPVISVRMMRAGLTGLARDFQAPLIENFLTENKIRITSDDFLGSWISGYLDFHQAEQSNQPALYKTAETKLLRALDLTFESSVTLDIARCRFLKALIDLKQKEYQIAADTFLEVSATMNELDPELAAESQWLGVRSLSELSRTNTRALIKASRAVDQLLRRFPGSTFAKRAEFEKLRINVSNLPPDEAIRRLKNVESSSPNYRLALNEATKIRYQAWLISHQSSQEDEPQKLASLIQAEMDFRQRVPTASNSNVKAILLVVDALLRTRAGKLETVRDRLDAAKTFVVGRGPVYEEYRYYEFQYAIRVGQQEKAEAEATWLLENASGTRFERSALIQLAQAADQRLKSKSETTPDDVREVLAVFDRLVGLLGTADETLKRQTNARVAYVRLAELKLDAGEAQEAIEMLESINRVFPNHKSYLRKLALAYPQTNQPEKATGIWRKLASGLEPGSNLWFESKYQLVFGLFNSGNRASARQVYDQTILLGNEIPQEWRTEFETLNELLRTE